MAKNRLKKYNEKRDFRKTPEPKGTLANKKTDKAVFVIQKHDASHLHYDFRLEIDGVLVSWAIPKGPSYNPSDKRLAVRTEDHPMSYGDFEGTIPENEYGGGTVMLWDTGTWTPHEKDPAKALKNGKISFTINGSKMAGDWTLTRMHGGKGNKENWLLIKNKDDYTKTAKAAKKFIEDQDHSVKTGRYMTTISTAVKTLSESKKTLKNLTKKYPTVQLATLVDEPPKNDNWIHEVKYDGYRFIAFNDHGNVIIHTRNGHDWTDRFPVLASALARINDTEFVIDGEAVVLDDDGRSSFKALQNSLGDKNAPLRAYIFDLLYWDGEDYSTNPLSDRRQALDKLFDAHVGSDQSTLFLSQIFDGRAEQIYEKACNLHLEGIISKDTKAPYRFSRSKSWVKSKCNKRQEFLICGYRPASDKKNAIGSLHLGYHDADDRLLYAGKVGTGFDAKTARALHKQLEPLARKTPPFDIKPAGISPDTTWVTPNLLCEVKFGFWTANGKVRHSVFEGLRRDKGPAHITRDIPARNKDTKHKGKTVIHNVHISHPDREIFPDAHITKSELAEFYNDMADIIMPSIKNRPLSVVRCPGGIEKNCFFQRSKGKGMDDDIHTVSITHDEKSHEYLYVKNIKGVLQLVQMGGIEFHPWGCEIDKTEKPDRIVFDLDPDPDIPFEAIRMAAQDIKNRLDNIGLKGFLKTTGGKGLHITVPLIRRHTWDTVKTFAHDFAARMVDDVPEAYTIALAKKKRRGKIFIDYLRNDFASTAVMDYCLRARPGGAVSMPLEWNELDDVKSADQFKINDARKRFKKVKKRIEDYENVQQNLTKDQIQSVQKDS